jgi:hypothetical protein
MVSLMEKFTLRGLVSWQRERRVLGNAYKKNVEVGSALIHTSWNPWPLYKQWSVGQ